MKNSSINTHVKAKISQGGRWHLAVYYNSLQSFIITFTNSLLMNFGDFLWILIGWFIKLSVQTFQPKNPQKWMYINLSGIVLSL